jgi:NTP pyrophosphatase (non-canonical NTP hydrolase)
MKHIITNNELDELVKDAQDIAAGDYAAHEPTARNHAALQARLVMVNAELIKTIRHLDEKNGKLQKLLFWLSAVATVATLVALFR